MNAGYANLIKGLFPKAHIIIDRFHLNQLINRAMNKTRIKIMNQFNTSNGEDMKKYRRLKRYWKLLLKKESDLSFTQYKYYTLFGQRIESAIVQEMLAYDEELKVNYDLYQKLLKAMSQKNYNALSDILDKRCPKETSTYIRTSLNTLRKHLPYIKIALTTFTITAVSRALIIRLKYLTASHMDTETLTIIRTVSYYTSI